MTKDRDDRKPRIAEPQRRQGVIRFEMPEDTLPESHRARVLWDVVGTLDLGTFLRDAKAVDGTAGRTTLSPRMKLVLWLYAISTGVGSAREIARLVRSDDAYRWIVGDLAVSHDTLSSFRVDHGAALDETPRFGDGAVVSAARVPVGVPRAGGVAPQGRHRAGQRSGADARAASGAFGRGDRFPAPHRR